MPYDVEILEVRNDKDEVVDAINIRRGGVTRELRIEFGLAKCDVSETSGDHIREEDKSYRERVKDLACRSTFASGSSPRQFLRRLEDYVEQCAEDDPSAVKGRSYFDIIVEGLLSKPLSHEDEYGETVHTMAQDQTGIRPTLSRLRTDGAAHEEYPLVPSGSLIPVDDANKLRYLDLWLRYKLEVEIDEAARWMSAGMVSVLPGAVWTLLSPEELEIVLGGGVLDDEALAQLKTSAVIQGFHGPQQGVVEHVWGAVESMGLADRHRFLQYVTGSSRLPPGGATAMNPRFSLELDTSKTGKHLPLATTCDNRLMVPPYDSLGQARDKLLAAMDAEGVGFGRA